MVLDGELWVVGGFAEATFQATGRVMAYDIAADTSRDAPPLITPRGALAVVVANGRIHAVGGEDAGQNSTAHEVFDPAVGLWAALTPLPTARNHLAAAVVGDAIVTLGGRNDDTYLLPLNEIYDLTTDTWRTGASVPTGRSGVAAVGPGSCFSGSTSRLFKPIPSTQAGSRIEPENSLELLGQVPARAFGEKV